MEWRLNRESKDTVVKCDSPSEARRALLPLVQYSVECPPCLGILCMERTVSFAGSRRFILGENQGLFGK